MRIGPSLALPSAANGFHGDFIMDVAESFARVTGGNLFEAAGLRRDAPGQSAWAGNFALLTHRGDQNAMLNYGNAFALNLWECSWDELIATPSTATAPEQDVADREALMNKVAKDNFVSGYSGRRISRKGRLFIIENATVWRLLDKTGEAFGVGAFFRTCRYLQPAPAN